LSNTFIDLPISVEEAIRFAVSGGVLVPDHQLLDKSGDAKVPAKIGSPKQDGTNTGSSPIEEKN